MDVKNAFLHGGLFEETYMEKLHGFVMDSSLVCQLHKLLYGLKKSHRDWYAKINSFFMSLGFKHCESNHSIYLLHVNGNTLIIIVYVDDLVITRNTIDLILGLKG